MLAFVLLANSSAISVSSNGAYCKGRYKIKKGDTLSEISQKFFGKPVWDSGYGSLWKVASCNSIENIHLIYPGDIIKIPDEISNYENEDITIVDTSGEREVNISVKNEGKVLSQVSKTEEVKVFDKASEFEGSEKRDEQNKSRKRRIDLGDRHKFIASVASHHQEIAAQQNRGNLSGNSANEIVSAVRLSAYLDYFYKLSKKFHLWSQVGILWSEYRPNLTNRIPDNDGDFIPTATLGGLYDVNSWLDLRFGARYLPQLYVFSNDQANGNLFFETDNTIWAILGADFTVLNRKKWNVTLSPEYHHAVVEEDLISNNSGYSLKLALGLGESRSWELFSRYYRGEYDFFSSDVTFERLELGASKRF